MEYRMISPRDPSDETPFEGLAPAGPADPLQPGSYRAFAPRGEHPRSEPPEAPPETERSVIRPVSRGRVLPSSRPPQSQLPIVLAPGALLLNRYALERPLSTSPLSEVWEGRGMPYSLPIAVKVLHASPRGVEMGAPPLREVRAVARLTHPGLVRILEVGHLDDGRPFVAMEGLRGPTLASELSSRGPLPAEEAIPLAIRLAEALGALHDKGILHGDLAPHGVMLDASERGASPKLLDFALSRVARKASRKPGRPAQLVGVADYASPEQIRGTGALDERSDVWSLGALLFRLVSGKPPFAAPSFVDTILAIVQREPALDQLPSGERRLAAVLQKALQKQPDRRFAGMAELAIALAELLHD
jgi:serine/threonine protein kinase